MIYELRFSRWTRRSGPNTSIFTEDAVQGCKSAGSTDGHILCSDDDPSAVIVILRWQSKEHLARWRGTESYKSFRAAVAELQTGRSHGGLYVAATI